MVLPDTRITLLKRLNDLSDTSAWGEFCTVYERAIYNIAKKHGLQDADAREVSQEVLLTVSRRVQKFDPTRDEKFRAWLTTIARNATIDLLRKNRGPKFTSQVSWEGEAVEAASQDKGDSFDIEARRELFRWAAGQVRATTSQPAWQAFWLTLVEGRAAAEVARELNISVGALYVARCRVLSRIRLLIEPFREESL